MNTQIPVLAGALVGRRRELGNARRAVEGALAGSGVLVVVTGEAGIGKTRLVDELTSTVAARTLWGSCWNDPGTPAFWPWTTVLRECAAATGTALGDDLAPVTGTAEPMVGPGRQLRLSLFDSVARYLVAAARVRPLVVVLEDLHFADEASLDLLRFLATALRGRPVAILGTYRDPDLEPGLPLAGAVIDILRAARSVPLCGLDEAEVGDLIRATTGSGPSGGLAARVRDRTGGNPLFVTEVAKLLATQGKLDTEHIPIPPSVQQVIAHRLGYIRGDTLDVLAQASVLGQSFSASLLARVVDVPPARIADLLDEAGAAGLVRPRPALGEFGFTHALVRDVLYAGIPVAARRTRHRLIAEAIESVHAGDLDDHADELADHYVLALPDADTSRAFDYTRRAGRRSLRMLAHEDAARRFARAVELAASGPLDEDDRIEALLELGDARMRAGDWPGAASAYQDVEASARRRNRADELARAALGFGAGPSGFEVRLYDHRQLDLLREALNTLDDSDAELRAWVLARLSVAESYLADSGSRLERSRLAVDEARRVGEAKLLVYALSSYCDAIAGPGHTEERLTLADEMVQLGVESHDPESELLGRRFRVVALIESGDLGGVESESEAFALAAEQLRWPLVEWYPPVWRGILALVEGRLDEAERLMGVVRDVGRRGGSVNARIVADVQQLQLSLERGRPEDAYELLRPFIEDPEGGPNAEAWRALPLARMGRRAEASAMIDRLAAAGFPLVMDAAWLEVIAAVAEACAEVGHREGARRLLPIIAPFADRFATGAFGAVCFGSMHRHAGLLAQCLGDFDTADEHFTRALRANRRAGATLLIAHTQRQHAALLQARAGPGDVAAAESMLAEADETYRQLGLAHWVPAEHPQTVDAAFRRDGDVWTVGYQGRETRVRDIKGMAVLARLLAEPGREFHVLDLASPGGGARRAMPSDTGEVIDAQARRAYQHRLVELDAEIDDATESGDSGRAERAHAERDALVEHVTAAYGLGGRARRGNDPNERARSTVTKQIHAAISRIGHQHPALALHLTNSVRTGRYCCYLPEHPVTWSL
ncbi:ATP-binding protein [Pseudonocardia nigra]|uniref:ATP-binding protein n=1 Tax=Pseudonocardia nigra TaxID=1921578 RepID=UPI001C5E29EB|nr:AAA family ATPase [Pseudonocardia nigra]